MTLLNDIKKRVEAATPGEWEILRGGGVNCVRAHVGSYVPTVADCSSSLVLGQSEMEANADFIARSKSDLRYLLGIAEAAQKLMEMVEELQRDHELHPSNPCEPLDELRAAIEGKGLGQ